MPQESTSNVHLKNGHMVETVSPIIYSGDYLMITNKFVSTLGTIGVVTSTITPYNLSEIKTIITNNLTKIYDKDEN